jgi:two-component system NarL family sensor kinase
LNNAIKHSEAQNINVNLQYTEDYFSLTIYDDGKGFNFDRVNKSLLNSSGAGVRNIQRRAELIGGQFAIETGVHKGTKIEIRLPQQVISTDSSQT